MEVAFHAFSGLRTSTCIPWFSCRRRCSPDRIGRIEHVISPMVYCVCVHSVPLRSGGQCHRKKGAGIEAIGEKRATCRA